MKALPWYFGAAGVAALVAGLVLRSQAAGKRDTARVSSLFDRVAGTGDGGAGQLEQAASYSTWSTVLLALAALLAVFTVIALLSNRRNASDATRTP